MHFACARVESSPIPPRRCLRLPIAVFPSPFGARDTMERDERPVARRRKALRLADQLRRAATLAPALLLWLKFFRVVSLRRSRSVRTPLPAGGRRDTAPRRSCAPPSPARGSRRYATRGRPAAAKRASAHVSACATTAIMFGPALTRSIVGYKLVTASPRPNLYRRHLYSASMLVAHGASPRLITLDFLVLLLGVSE